MTAAAPAAGQRKKNWLTNPGQKLAGQHELSSEQHIQNSPPANIPSHPASWPVLSVLNMLAQTFIYFVVP